MTRHNAALNHQRDATHHANVTRAIREAINRAEAEAILSMRLPGDPWAMRGIPAVGGRGSVGGAIAGTRPDTLSWVDETPKKRRL